MNWTLNEVKQLFYAWGEQISASLKKWALPKFAAAKSEAISDANAYTDTKVGESNTAQGAAMTALTSTVAGNLTAANSYTDTAVGTLSGTVTANKNEAANATAALATSTAAQIAALQSYANKGIQYRGVIQKEIGATAEFKTNLFPIADGVYSYNARAVQTISGVETPIVGGAFNLVVSDFNGGAPIELTQGDTLLATRENGVVVSIEVLHDYTKELGDKIALQIDLLSQQASSFATETATNFGTVNGKLDMLALAIQELTAELAIQNAA